MDDKLKSEEKEQEIIWNMAREASEHFLSDDNIKEIMLGVKTLSILEKDVFIHYFEMITSMRLNIEKVKINMEKE